MVRYKTLAVSQKGRCAILFCHRFDEGPQAFRVIIDCKTVGFFLKISKEIGNAWRKSLMGANRASLTRRACEAREKKPTVRFPYNEFVPTRGFKNVVASLSSLALCFQPRSRPFVWLLARTWIRKNTDCFAVYSQLNWVHFWGLTSQLSRNKILVVWLGDFLRFERQCKVWWVNGLTPKYRKILRC